VHFSCQSNKKSKKNKIIVQKSSRLALTTLAAYYSKNSLQPCRELELPVSCIAALGLKHRTVPEGWRRKHRSAKRLDSEPLNFTGACGEK